MWRCIGGGCDEVVGTMADGPEGGAVTRVSGTNAQGTGALARPVVVGPRMDGDSSGRSLGTGCPHYW
jgi:hypothetical protein